MVFTTFGCLGYGLIGFLGHLSAIFGHFNGNDQKQLRGDLKRTVPGIPASPMVLYVHRPAAWTPPPMRLMFVQSEYVDPVAKTQTICSELISCQIPYVILKNGASDANC